MELRGTSFRQGESGDHHLVCCNQNGILIAAIDGIGHGEEAANAAKAAAAFLRSSADEPIISLVEGLHEKLRATRGVVMSVALIDPEHGMMIGSVSVSPRGADARRC